VTAYAVFGGCLRSEVPFPALAPAPAGMRPRWTLRVVSRPRDAGPCALLGDDHVDAGVRVRLHRHAAGLRLEFDDTGTFDVLEGGREIEWHPGAGGVEAARLDVLGRVLPAALHAAGTLCLHGSAVAFAAGGIAFLAPKFHGKSTLAQALVRAGAALLSDDVVPADAGPPPRLYPGVQHVRLWGDSAARLAGGADVAEEAGGKRRVAPAGEVPGAPVPALAVYLLSPAAAAEGVPAARRTRLAPLPAAMALIGHARLAPLLGKREAAVLLDRAAALAAEVPVYALEVVRDFGRLDEAVERIRAWHPAPASAPASRPARRAAPSAR
jgi:hypothetical protein